MANRGSPSLSRKPRKAGLERSLRRRLLALLEKREQVGIDPVSIGCGHSVWETWIHDQLRPLNDLCRHSTRGVDRHDLIVVAMHDESRYVELLEVLRKIRLGESFDAVIV